MTDLYAILGLTKEATVDEIKRAYRRLAQRNHPDRKGGSEDKFKDVKAAYETLSNEQKRRIYDETGQFASEGDRDSRVRTKLAGLLFQLLDSGAANVASTNMVEWMQHELFNAKPRIVQELENLRGRVAQDRQVATRFMRLNGGENTLATMLLERARRGDGQVQKMEEWVKSELEDIDRALEMLSEYSYIVDQQQVVFMFGGMLCHSAK